MDKGVATKAIAWILVVQTLVSALIAIAVIGGLAYVGLQATQKDRALEIFANWGGVIIGFYFGTAFTQISTLVRAFDGRSEDPKAEEK